MPIEVEHLSNKQLLFLINKHGDRGTATEPLYGDAVDEMKRREADNPRLWMTIWRRRLLRYLGKAIAAIMILFVLSWYTFFFAGFPLMGVITGHLHLPGRNGTAIDIQGPWARAISVPLLVFYIFGTRSILRQIRDQQGPTGMKRMLAALVIAACVVGLVFLGWATDNS